MIDTREFWSEQRQRPIVMFKLKEGDKVIFSTANQFKLIDYMAEEYRKCIKKENKASKKEKEKEARQGVE